MSKITEEDLEDLRAATEELQMTAVACETKRRINDIIADVQGMLDRHGIRCFIKGLVSGFMLGIVAAIITVGILWSASN